MNFYGIEKGSM